MFTPMLHEVSAGDLLFGRETEQLITPRDVEAASDRSARISVHAKQATSRTAGSALDDSAASRYNQIMKRFIPLQCCWSGCHS